MIPIPVNKISAEAAQKPPLPKIPISEYVEIATNSLAQKYACGASKRSVSEHSVLQPNIKEFGRLKFVITSIETFRRTPPERHCR
jgi:hypothetical protein